VILVIGNHAHAPGFGAGYIGVDIFFVVSGFVITQLLLRETHKGVSLGLKDFYSRRIRRIVPAATATLIGTLIVAQLALGTGVNPNLPGDVRWTSLFAANFRLINTGSNYFVPGIFPSLITHFWSLAIEEQFYLVFPIVVFLIARHVSPDRRVRVLALTLLGGIALSAWWSIHITASEPAAAYYSPFTRFWELGLGCLLATITTRPPIRTVRSDRLAMGAGCVLLLIALVHLNSSSVYPGWLAWLPCGATFLLIWAGGRGARTPATRVLSNRRLAYIGDISYSLYLWHWVWFRLPEQLPTPLTGFGWRVLEIIGTVITSVLCYHLLENPIRRSRRLAADRVAILLVLVVCVVASWTTAAIVERYIHLG